METYKQNGKNIFFTELVGGETRKDHKRYFVCKQNSQKKKKIIYVNY